MMFLVQALTGYSYGMLTFIRQKFKHGRGLTVGDYNTSKARLVDDFDGLATENAVGDNGKDLLGTMLVESGGSLGKLQLRVRAITLYNTLGFRHSQFRRYQPCRQRE